MPIKYFRTLFFLWLFLFATISMYGQHSEPGEASKKTIQEYILGSHSSAQNWLEKNKVPAIGIVIIKEGQVVKKEVFGNLKKGKPAPENTIFNVASLTKPIVTLLTLKLVSHGSWSLDEPIYHYWVDPDVAHDSLNKKLTTRHILTHQTGFTNWRKNHQSGKLTFDFEPGSRYQYSGEGFEYLRKALESKFAMSLENLADSLVFRPLNMKDSYFTWKDDSLSSRYAVNHDKDGIALETFKPKAANAANNLLTTIEDYANFVLHVLDGGGLSPTVFQEMKSRQVKTPYESYFGLGWEIIPDWGGEEVLMHSGGNPGVSTLAMLFPKTKRGLLIFSNSNNGGFPVWREIINQSLD